LSQLNTLLPGIRLTNALLALGAAGLIGVGLYMQYFMHLYPCALCITQRIFIIAGGVVAAVAAISGVQGPWRRGFAALGVILAVIGAGFAGRHVWLQNLPEELVPACGPSLDYLFDVFPWQQALEVLLQGDGNCADVSWSFLGLSIPALTFIAFSGIILLNLWQLVRKS
jgi:disulfide bond formation protein DsbB